MSDEIMSVKDTANYLNIKKQTVYRLLKKDKIPALKIGGQWKIKKSHLDKMFDQILQEKLDNLNSS